MKKVLLFIVCILLLVGCNINPSKEERIQKLEAELEVSLRKIDELEKKMNMKNVNNSKRNNLILGAFSVSLAVKDITISKKFYENLGFEQLGGDLEKNYLIMKNKNSIIGLFQGMFEDNILTFNPGWDENAKETKTFLDIRKIQQELKNKGLNVGTEIDINTSGPASFMVTDPDGNLLLIDQHR